MVRYIMSFSVPQDKKESAKKIIGNYFDALLRHGPGGMRSQCYADNDNECSFVHIKSFIKESVANQHFRSPAFREYIQGLTGICENAPGFMRLQQQKTFESIY